MRHSLPKVFAGIKNTTMHCKNSAEEVAINFGTALHLIQEVQESIEKSMTKKQKDELYINRKQWKRERERLKEDRVLCEESMGKITMKLKEDKKLCKKAIDANPKHRKKIIYIFVDRTFHLLSTRS